MFKNIYKQLFDFTIKNRFYQNGVSATNSLSTEDFHILVGENTSSLLSENRLIFKRKPNGFLVLSQVNETAPDVFSVSKKIDKKTKLTFYVVLNNAKLLDFSDVSFSKLANGQIYYFNNLKSNADLRDKLRLSLDNTVDEPDMLKAKNAIFSYEHIGLVDKTNVKIISVESNLPVNVDINVNKNNGVTNLKFDMSNQPEGRYRLEISGNLIEEFYFLGKQSNVFGVIEIFFEGLEDNYKIIEADNSLTAVRPSYQIDLARRKSFWRYVLNTNTIPTSNLTIETSDASVVFVNSSTTNKKKIFTSVALIDCVENPLVQFNSNFRVLLRQDGTEIRPNLPVPQNFKIENNQNYSEITLTYNKQS